MPGGPQQALAEPDGELLPACLQRDGVQSVESILVGTVGRAQNDPKAALLDPLESQDFLPSEA